MQAGVCDIETAVDEVGGGGGAKDALVAAEVVGVGV